MEQVGHKGRKGETGSEDHGRALHRVVVEPNDSACAVVFGTVDTHLAAAEELVSVTPGIVRSRRPSAHALAALALPVSPRLRH